MKVTKGLITERISCGLQHYLTDHTSWGRPEDGLQDTHITITTVSENQIVILTGGKRFTISVVENLR